jgi:hypothetical protein
VVIQKWVCRDMEGAASGSTEGKNWDDQDEAGTKEKYD